MNKAMAADSTRIQYTGDWLADLENLMRRAFQFQIKWKGITTYQHLHNKHRLFQDAEPGEIDQGLAFFNRAGKLLQSSGMPADKAAMAYHLLMLFLTSVAINHINSQEPASHRQFLKSRQQKLDAEQHPGASFLLGAFPDITTQSTFDTGLAVLLTTIAAWAPTRKDKPARKTSRPVRPKA
jgi:hypothetical protein